MDFAEAYEENVLLEITLGALSFFFMSACLPVFPVSEAPSTELSSSSNCSLIGALSWSNSILYSP